MIPCTIPTHFTDTVSHELGHLLGLVDQGTSCGRHIMAPRQVSSSGAYTDREVQEDECDLVAETLETPSERRLRCGIPSRTPSGTAGACRVFAALDDCTDDGTGGGGPGGGSDPRDPGSPVVVDLDRAGFRFTSLAEGVSFDLDADGVLDRVSWTAGDAGDAFLVLDRNDNDRIDDGSELFGDHTEQPPGAARHGFRALAVFDDDGDGWITELDSAFPLLRLWIDASHDGQSQPSELVSLHQASVRAIGVDPVESRRLDRHGNQLRYKALVRLTSGTTQAVDVFLVMQ